MPTDDAVPRAGRAHIIAVAWVLSMLVFMWLAVYMSFDLVYCEVQSPNVFQQRYDSILRNHVWIEEDFAALMGGTQSMVNGTGGPALMALQRSRDTERYTISRELRDALRLIWPPGLNEALIVPFCILRGGRAVFSGQ